MDILYCMVKGCLHEPGISRQWGVDDQDIQAKLPKWTTAEN